MEGAARLLYLELKCPWQQTLTVLNSDVTRGVTAGRK